MPMSADVPPYLDDLAATLDVAWALLEQGARDRRSPSHTPTLATTAIDGQAALRTVVLRAGDRGRARLLIHTDRRSGKCAELLRDPRCALHIYDAAQKIQLRLQATATLHLDDALADEQWAATRATSRIGYGIRHAPGSVIDDPAPVSLGLEQRSSDEQRGHFAVIALQLQQIDWLYLSSAGHRRARFMLAPTASAQWLVP